MAVPGAEGLVERELETAHLLRAIDHSWHGVGRLVVIEGPAGIGKTSLVGTARELARASGMNVRGAIHESDDESIYPRLHGLYWMCANLAREQPLALLVDDAHWADEPSLAFLGFLARRLDELPILLVLAVGPTDLSATEALPALLVDPLARPTTRELPDHPPRHSPPRTATPRSGLSVIRY